MAPKLGALAFIRIDWPAIAMVCATPSSLLASCLDVLHHLLGARQRRRVGKLHVHQQIALVLRGDEPGRRAHEGPVGQPQQTRRRPTAPARSPARSPATILV